MKYKLVRGIATALPILSLAAAAQVPVDHGLRFSFGTPTGMEIIDVTGGGTATPVAGLAPIYNENNSGSIDPVTGEIWTGGISFSAGTVGRHTLQGAVAVSSTFVASVSGLSLKSIDFDWNGDVFTCDRNTIFKIDRATGTSTVWDSDAGYPGTFNALCVDMARNFMYLGTFDQGAGSVLIEYDLSLGPGPGTVVLDVTAFGFTGSISGIDDNAGGTLYVTTHDGSNSLFSHIVQLGLTAPVVGAPPVGLNDCWFDRKTGQVHAVGAGGDDDYYTIDPVAGTFAQVTLGADIGSPSNVAVNDFLNRTEAFPQRPSASSAFLFEAAAHGNAGDIGGVAIVAFGGSPIVPVVFGVSVCDLGGFATFQAPVTAASALPGDKFTLQSARLDIATGTIVLGNPLEVIFQP